MALNTRKRMIRLALVVGVLLLIPLIAMQFTDEVVWTLSDFIIAGALLFGAGLTYELVSLKGGFGEYRVAVGVAVATGLLLVWANLAVGLIGSENEPANLMYLGVLAVGINGAIVARLKPRGMAFAMFATALAQALVAVIALIAGMQYLPESSVAEILTVNGFFVELFVISGLLFRNADATKHGVKTTAAMSEKASTPASDISSDIISWTFSIIFVVIGVLNLLLVHPVPGLFYLLVALLYIPLANAILRKRVGFAIPLAAKVLMGLAILWATLAVTDLADILGL